MCEKDGNSICSCTCTAGWTGPDCSEDINECDSEPCLNGATCYESVIQGQFVCICPPFYTGDFCHQHFSPCDLPYNPCINNSTCLAQVDGNPLCICKTGFEGTNCEVNTDECASHPCQHQGLCVDGVNHYKFLCNCVPGYYGSLCEMDVNECETLPCLHGGSCINRLGGYQCFCTPGFTGDRCEINIDECISTPCLNNGNCIDDISSYKCHCNRGFIGTKCEINECESVPCINGGSCQDLDNAFVCTCLSGYTGEFCEVDIDVCSEPALNSALCYNGGICVDGPGRIFRCRLNNPRSLCWVSLPPGYIAGSWSTWCPPGLAGPFLQSCFPASQLPACTGAWGYFSPDAGFSISLCCIQVVGKTVIYTVA
uniref:EGF-like domain-containing protein n=1 Tax=Apteryx owenii TaxID=8824 RepID=A0A8B9P094_APTOW